MDKNNNMSIKHRLFCQAMIDHGGNATRAYKAVYDMDGTMTDNVAGAAAARLLRKVSVEDYMEEIMAENDIKSTVTLEKMVYDLEKMKNQALMDGKYAAYVAATQQIAKMLGFNAAEKQEVTVSGYNITFGNSDEEDTVDEPVED